MWKINNSQYHIIFREMAIKKQRTRYILFIEFFFDIRKKKYWYMWKINNYQYHFRLLNNFDIKYDQTKGNSYYTIDLF